MLAKPWKNFPQDDCRIAAIGTNQIAKMIKIKWPCHGTFQYSMASWINHLYLKHTLLLLLNSPVFTLWICVKTNGITSFKHKLTLKTWSYPVQNKNFCYFLHCHWHVVTSFTTSMLAMLFTSVTAFLKVFAKVWLPLKRMQSCLCILLTFWIMWCVVSSISKVVPVVSNFSIQYVTTSKRLLGALFSIWIWTCISSAKLYGSCHEHPSDIVNVS